MNVQRNIVRSLALGALAIPALVLGSTGTEPGTVMGKVESTFRRVEVLPLGKGRTWQALNKGDEVRVADWIRTGPRGRARIVFADRFSAKNAGPTVVNVGSASELKMEKYLTRFDRPEKSEGVLALLRGTIRAFTKNWGPESAFSVRVGTSLCGIRGSEIGVFAGVPGAEPQGGAPFQGDAFDAPRPANATCFDGTCLAGPSPFGGSLNLALPTLNVLSGSGAQSIAPGTQLVMGNSNDPRTWRVVPLTQQRRQDILGQTGIPGQNQGVPEGQLWLNQFGGTGGSPNGAPGFQNVGPTAALDRSELGGGPQLMMNDDEDEPIINNSGFGNVGSNRFSNFDVHGGGALPQGTTFQDFQMDDDDDDDDDDQSDVVGVGPSGFFFADGRSDSTQASGWNGRVLPDLTQYQAGLQTLRQLGQSIVDGNLQAFMATFSPNATQDTSIFRNGFLDDLQRDQNSTVNLDFEVFEYRLAGSAWSGGTLIIRLRWLLTINGTQVQDGISRILFDRDSGYRIVAWLGASPFGRNDSQTQSQLAAGDPNVSTGSGPLTGSGTYLMTFTAAATTHESALTVDADTNQAQEFTNSGSIREADIDNNSPSGVDFVIDVASANFGFLQVSTRSDATGQSPVGVEDVFKCQFSPSLSTLGVVDPVGATAQNISFTIPAPGSFNHTFGFRTTDGRYGIGLVSITVPSGSPPKDMTVQYEYKLSRVADTKTVVEGQTGVCQDF